MPKFTLPLRDKQQVAEGTMAFRLELPAPGWPFQPGQFVSVAIPNPPYQDEKGSSRSFSLASSPGEDCLLIATRMTGTAYKRSLAELQSGANLTVSGPYGSVVLPAAPTPVALFAGGIGITPFRSMIKDALEHRSPRPITLVYANRTPADAAFLHELQAWEQASPRFRLLATMTQAQRSSRSWPGLTGYVDAAFLKTNLPVLAQCGCYVAGPPRFVAGVVAALAAAGVDKDAIHADEFTGY